ncbi:hypothetical protein BD410DRAFT_176864 [Rickenella mellea]|uniref:Zn(2)-C6 fungal-type domain-containing protein n=1 Tax=Rickenella mellea TaxID=50990 RepID=A0A4Y7Q6L1_9AGAM|nr:hypothetical protein BD410DRAFT_176864 [Rickenella mellea]
MCLKAPSTTLRGKRQCTPKNRSVNKHACARCAISHVKCDMDEPFSLAMCCRCSNLRLICPGYPGLLPLILQRI